MQIIKTHNHPEVHTLEIRSIFTRLATRSIAVQEDTILLLYTARYEDYSLPGGGLDLGEDKVSGMTAFFNSVLLGDDVSDWVDVPPT